MRHDAKKDGHTRELARWFTPHVRSMAVLCGGASGGLLCIDFDVLEFYHHWLALVGAHVAALPAQRTGKGMQVFCRCAEPGCSTKLAAIPDPAQPCGWRVAIETRGDGGYACVDPSLHPCGRHYAFVHLDLPEVPFLDAPAVAFLIGQARSLNRVPDLQRKVVRKTADDAVRVVQRRRRIARLCGEADGVIDAWNERVPVASVLGSHGYTVVGDEFSRPGKPFSAGASGQIVACRDGVERSVHFSTNDPLNDEAFGDATACGIHDSFDAFAALELGGDARAAVRLADLPRGIVPATAQWVTVGVDLGKYLCHWVVVAWSPSAVGHVIDYGRHEVASDSLGVEQALMVAMREMKEMFNEGWPSGSSEGQRVQPGLVFVDSGYMAQVVYPFCRESGERFRPAVGRGASQQHRQWYNRPTQTGSVCRFIGEGYHANHLPAEGLLLVEVDADHWKTWVHQRLSTLLEKPGAMTLFRALPNEHLSLAKHLTAEIKTEEFVAGKGVVVKWERIRRQNHWFDALYNACAAGHACGVRLVDEQVPQPPPRQRRSAREDEMPWIDPAELLGWTRPRRW